MTHPRHFPYHPNDQSSVMPYLEICCLHHGQAGGVTHLNCTQPVRGRFLVITMPNISSIIHIREVVVDSEGRLTVILRNNASFGDVRLTTKVERIQVLDMIMQNV